MNNLRLKEAVKAAIAFVIAYAIALKVNWMTPAWAGYAVTMIAFPTFNAGQSFRKTILRLSGTIPGSVAALIILSIAPQSRWLFIVLVCIWMFFTSYMMNADSKHSYMWNVAGFTCLIVILAGPSSSASAFDHALYRSIDNILGMLVYTLVALFIWPYKEEGKIKTTATSIVNDQGRVIKSLIHQIEKGEQLMPTNFEQIHKKIENLNDVISTETIDNKEARHNKKNWLHVSECTTAINQSLLRLTMALVDLKNKQPIQDVAIKQSLFNDLINKWSILPNLLSGKKGSLHIKVREFSVFQNLIFDDKQDPILEIIKEELIKIDTLTNKLIVVFENINAKRNTQQNLFKTVRKSRKDYFYILFDRDFLRGGIYVVLCTFIGFVLWIEFDPIGHSQWFMMTGTMAMLVGVNQQMDMKKFMTKFSVLLTLGGVIYVFILPQISTFFALGSVLFLLMFLIYYFLDGYTYVVGCLCVMSLGITNSMTFDFAAYFNESLFNVIVIVVLVIASYLIDSTRPEIGFKNQIVRFFESYLFLLEEHSNDLKSSIWRKIQVTFAEREIHSLPSKIEKWLPEVPITISSVSKEQLSSLTIVIRRLSIAMDMWRTSSVHQNTPTDLEQFNLILIEFLQVNQKKLFKDKLLLLPQFELASINSNQYKVVGSYRLLKDTLDVYNKTANTINWNQLLEERFS
ncbi:FUSC family protein [Flammeovirga kamogawensis]|uniref:FUSC family protein n=1 Tax=Flammeovirga kamogawensis TaxID=373891 RepID=A0ABX8H2G5_9BACT|nr:FUSC family protein [Flammeovirga kamogawensis]MBB6463591.1 uncharacterized membrane protein YgaE (UPF0421/DUF939 family) [Flammeovirga kamogawensis]QWG09818.1 FUSC family protein [Flammeovirga kamogawensis]TRX65326.1 hypothetical protein EO216_22650 [Flammeovirga kamogawensis]